MKDEELSDLMVRWNKAFLHITMQEVNRVARSRGLSMLQLTVLFSLYHGGPRAVTDFTDMMQISPAAASQMVERLVHEGMVERQPAETDRRVREVHLTALGRTQVEVGIAARRKWFEDLVEDLPDSSRSIVGEALAILVAQIEHIRQTDVNDCGARGLKR